MSRSITHTHFKPIDAAASRTVTRMATICEAVAQHFGVSVTCIRGRASGKAVSRARQEAMRLMKEAGHSLPKIGRFLDGRDHTTVLHGVRAAQARMEGRA